MFKQGKGIVVFHTSTNLATFWLYESYCSCSSNRVLEVSSRTVTQECKTS